MGSLEKYNRRDSAYRHGYGKNKNQAKRKKLLSNKDADQKKNGFNTEQDREGTEMCIEGNRIINVAKLQEYESEITQILNTMWRLCSTCKHTITL